MRSPRTLLGIRQPRTEVFHLHIGTTYYWTVTARSDDEVAATSPTWSFTTHAATPRWISVPGITNVRDIGGWSLPNGNVVSQGHIYRGSEMHPRLTITEAGRRILEDNLRIKTDLDLRAADETTGPVLNPDKVRWVNAPILPYAHIAEAGQPEQYRQVFAMLADPANHPVFLHCFGGADRVGTVIFMLGALLGKDVEHLGHDYELTSFSIWGIRSRYSDEFQSLLTALRAHAPGGTVLQQVEAYLLDAGVTAAELSSLRNTLITSSRNATG